jgi:hypothetical protein
VDARVDNPGVGLMAILLGLSLWGIVKCRKLAASEHVNALAVRGLAFSLGGLALLGALVVLPSLFFPPLRQVSACAVGGLGLAGAVLSVRGLARWSQYPLGRMHGVGGLLLGGGLAALTASVLLPMPWRDASSAESLARAARAASKGLPRAIDTESELALVESDGRALIYHVRLMKVRDDHAGISSLISAVTSRLIATVCSDESTRSQLQQHGVVLRFEYVDGDGKPIGSIDAGAACRTPP